jgi:PEP-CTERM motif
MFNSTTCLRFFSSVPLLILFLLPGTARASIFPFGASTTLSCEVDVDFAPSDINNLPYNAVHLCSANGEYDDFYGEGQNASASGTASAIGNTGEGYVKMNLATSANSTQLIDGAVAKAADSGRWYDTVTITGPPNTPLNYTVFAGMDGSMTCQGETFGSVNYGISYSVNGFSLGTGSFSDNNCDTPFDQSQKLVLTAYDGEQVKISAGVVATAVAIAGNHYGDPLEYHLSAENNIDASDTFSFFITPITPGASYISASGYDYSIPGTPEPSTWAMLIVGFAGLGIVGWRRGRGPRLSLTLARAREGARFEGRSPC